MHKKAQLAGIFFVALMLASACSPTPAETLPAPEIIEEVNGNIASTTLPEKKEIVLIRKEGDPPSWDIFLQNPINSDMEFFANIFNVYEEHYHNREYHQGHVYLIRRIGDYMVDEDWRDELWRLDAEGEEKLLFSSQGHDFRVSEQERYIAISANENVIILDFEGNELIRFKDELVNEDVDRINDGLIGWSDDESALWLRTSGPDLFAFVKILSDNWQISSHDVRDVGIRVTDLSVNENTGIAVFSDYPMFFAAFIQEEFEEKGTAVTLSIYDIEGQSSEDIAISAAKEFDPIWLDDQVIEFNDPLSEGRSTYTLR